MPHRPRRLLLNTLTTLSILLLIATLALWVRSYTTNEQLTYIRPDGSHHVRTAPGHLVLGFNLADWSHELPDFYGLHYVRHPPIPAVNDVPGILVLSIGPNDTFENWQHGNFHWLRWRSASRQNSIALLILPFWSLTLLFALLPLTRLLLALRPRRRLSPTLCPTCNYDCRATPHRCPECGTIPP